MLNDSLNVDIEEAVRAWYSLYEVDKFPDINRRMPTPYTTLDKLMKACSGYTNLNGLYKHIDSYKKNKTMRIRDIIALKILVLTSISYEERKYMLRKELESTYNDNYNTAMWIFQTEGGKAFSYKIPKFNMDKPWTVDGKNFTQELNDKSTAYNTLMINTLLMGLAGAWSISKIVSQVLHVNQSQGSTNKALVYNELTYAIEKSKLDCAKSLFTRYRFSAILDEVTSKICKSMNGIIFLYSQAIIGVNYPPLHLWCRSIAIPILSSMNIPDNAVAINTDMSRELFLSQYNSVTA